MHNNLGIALMATAEDGDDAIAEFRAALALDPSLGEGAPQPGDALASAGQLRRGDRAVPPRRAPRSDRRGLHYDFGSLLLEARSDRERSPSSAPRCKPTPQSVQAHNNLGIALGIQGRLDEAIDHFQQALAIQPDFEDARRNLALAVAQKAKTKG